MSTHRGALHTHALGPVADPYRRIPHSVLSGSLRPFQRGLTRDADTIGSGWSRGRSSFDRRLSMKKLLIGFAAVPFLAGIAMAGQPKPLTDAQMDKVTAGQLIEVEWGN